MNLKYNLIVDVKLLQGSYKLKEHYYYLLVFYLTLSIPGFGFMVAMK